MIAVDTGFLYALVDRNDAWHERARAMAPTSSDGWITTWPVLTEATHLMMRWLGPEFACALMDDVASGGIMLWEPSEPQVGRIPALSTWGMATSCPPTNATSAPTAGRTASRSRTCWRPERLA
jgi:hypothetical protein